MEICKTNASPGQRTAAPEGKLNVAGLKFHFIGAGGIGMSGLARVLLKNSAIVTGSDQAPTAVTDMLSQAGADIKIGHRPDNLDPETDTVVISAAIDQDNPELRFALRKGLRIYKYARMLGELMDSYHAIAVSGTHGKSTTSGWLSYCLDRAGLEPNFIIGGDVPQLGGSSGVGNGGYFVAEACEYDRSFLNLRPAAAAILNVEQDHLDYYKDEQDIIDAFTEFAQAIRPDGVLVANGAEANTAEVIRRLDGSVRCETFGLEKTCGFYADHLRLNDGLYAFDVYHDAALLGPTRISLPGGHNVLNALAVVALAVNVGLDAERVLELLPGFTGVDRRLSLKGQFNGITVLDDYAHHPTEINASLKAMRQRYRPKRIWCIFQPHQYSRTRFLLDDFAESFTLADVTIVPDIYFVRDSEQAKRQVNSQILVDKICSNGSQAVFINEFDSICRHLQENVTGGDLVVTMGAGDIWKVSDEYIRWLRANS